MIAACENSTIARVTTARMLAPRQAALVARGPRMVRPSSRGACVVRCMAKGDKDAAARKALQQALGGYAKGKDILADYDPSPETKTGGDGGDKGGFFGGFGGGGGGGGGFGSGEPFFNNANKTTLSALALFVGAIFIFTCWKPTLAVLVNLIFLLFRLDPNPKGLTTAGGPSSDASAEESIMSQWGDDEDEDEE